MDNRVETLLAELHGLRLPEAERIARDLVAAVLELHAAGLERVVGVAAKNPGLLEELLNDPAVASLLVLHDLHPVPLDVRVAQALQTIAPAFEAEGVRPLSTVEGKRVRVRLTAGAGGPASDRRLELRVRQTLLEAVPDAEITVEGPEPPPQLLTLRVPERRRAEDGR
jgi:hypothetical protein